MDPEKATHELDFFLNGVVRTTADLREENCRLKAQSERLEKRLSEIMPQLELLRKERVALKGAIGVLLRQSGALPGYADDEHRQPETFATLPYEILQHIFSLAIHAEPAYQFDPSVRPGAHNPWFELVRMKKAFPLICRASLWPGMLMLYSDVVLRRMGQVSAFAETLRIPDVGPRLGTFIKSIRWDSCVVAAPCSDVIREDLTSIFTRCSRLQSFSFYPHTNFPLRCTIPEDDDCEGYFNPLWFVMMSPSVPDYPLLQTTTFNLRSLDLGDLCMDEAILHAIHKLLPALNILESLILGEWPTDPPILPEDSGLMKLPAVSLPALTNLQIFATSAASDKYLCTRWEVHKLARFTILACNGWPGELLAQFGRGLRYLHLFPTQSVFSEPPTFCPTLEACSTLVEVCPVLEHLIVPLLATPYTPFINSPTLLHLDLWKARGKPMPMRRQDQSLAASYLRHATRPGNTLPSLRTVRLLFTWGPKDALSMESSGSSWSGCRSHVRNPDWPWICHPSLLPEGSDDVLYYRFPQGWVAQTVATVIPQDLGEYGWEEPLDWNWENDWPAVYVHFEELLAGMHTNKPGASVGGTDEGVEEQPEGDGVEGEDNDAGGEKSRIVASDDDEARVRDEQEKREQEEQERLEAATELDLPEYPVVQLDRATVLAAFRSSRDRESYNHINIWDNH
ncbi:hypothetical protein GSI_02610 [Ganoderma sinense ZZ0214-1]|uniref:F-box domain-containing protein n=1 Tax=Ganoderma sinense ZZ0214-1 TaxID=1077348 RepID=A0A2G8SM65_9APHY|nr:hypothetical protein GSI_02610 [Ganoderma sinense ZZ0214-1]